MSDHDQHLLVANAAFYTAFSEQDLESMEEIWAQSDLVACIHPGWGALHGRRAVMESWRTILGGEDALKIHFTRARVYRREHLAFVTCLEHLPNGTLVSTNIFVLEDDNWKMVHHHAGPAPPAADEVASELLN